ncbi:Hypothetical protein NTJ_11607 [Nesidiocoris tenuis]|uniref:Uncharacterized protein n=1 Tax=Nesidiocoris tenuis TaxID=355587 RepID=A0ABN7B5A4_9HEMI|nr:Hypothetical protein NTJ_11607 [Nesidiocoris tenuis]
MKLFGGQFIVSHQILQRRKNRATNFAARTFLIFTAPGIPSNFFCGRILLEKPRKSAKYEFEKGTDARGAVRSSRDPTLSRRDGNANSPIGIGDASEGGGHSTLHLTKDSLNMRQGRKEYVEQLVVPRRVSTWLGRAGKKWKCHERSGRNPAVY